MADLTKDPFEEFEFRPINEGLGFHNRNKTTPASTPASFNIKPSTPASNTTTSFSTNTTFSTPTTFSNPSPFATPLPRNTNTGINTKPNYNIPTIEDDSIAKAQTAVNEILKNLNQKRQLDFATETERASFDLKKSRPILFAAALDAMLIIAAFLMSMIAMLSITKVDLFLNLSHPETSGLIYVATGILFVTVAFIYMVINRAFMGFTPGEWAFDQRLGQTQDSEKLTYVPKIALRSLIVMGTGFIVMPMLSYLFNKDVTGQIIGLSLYRKANAE